MIIIYPNGSLIVDSKWKTKYEIWVAITFFLQVLHKYETIRSCIRQVIGVLEDFTEELDKIMLRKDKFQGF